MLARRLFPMLAACAVALVGCANPAPPPRQDSLSGLVPSGFVPERSPITLAQPARDSGVIVIPSPTSDAAVKFFEDFDRGVRGDKVDLFGYLAQHKASEDPRNSILMVTQLLKKCFGTVEVAKDFPSAAKLQPPIVAVVGIHVDYPFWGSWKAHHELKFLDKRARAIQTVEGHGSLLPRPFHHTEGLVVQQRAADKLTEALVAARGGQCLG